MNVKLINEIGEKWSRLTKHRIAFLHFIVSIGLGNTWNIQTYKFVS